MESSPTKLPENTEQEASTTSATEEHHKTSADQEAGETGAQETGANDSGTDEKIEDHTVEEQDEKSKDGNHSDPETAELEESRLSSIKEPRVDFADGRKISMDTESESTSEVLQGSN